MKFGQRLAVVTLSLADPPRLARELLRPYPQPMTGTLETDGVTEPVEFATKEGLICRGWWVRPEEGTDPDRCVVLAHGWTSHALRMQSLVPPLLKQGFAILLYNARSHGNSDWFPICSAQQFAEDVEAAVAFARRRARRVAVLGHSLGAAGTILAAADGVMDAAVALASPADAGDGGCAAEPGGSGRTGVPPDPAARRGHPGMQSGQHVAGAAGSGGPVSAAADPRDGR